MYSSFLQRGFDQIIHDAATANLPVRLLIDRAGIVGEDGETHQGVFDVSFLKAIPNINIYSPASYDELKYRIKFAANTEQISAVRYPRGCEKRCLPFELESDFSLIKGKNKSVIVTYGRLYSEASAVKNKMTDINIVKLNKIYPLSSELIFLLSDFENIHFFEETEKSGGIGEYLAALLLENGYKGNYTINAVENKFVAAAGVSSSLKANSLDSQAMIKEIEKYVPKN